MKKGGCNVGIKLSGKWDGNNVEMCLVRRWISVAASTTFWNRVHPAVPLFALA